MKLSEVVGSFGAALFGLVPMGLAACADESQLDPQYIYVEAGPVGAADAEGGMAPAACTTVRSPTEPIPSRLAAMSTSAGPTEQTVFVHDLFNSFNSLCGACHVSTTQGKFQIANFLKMKEQWDPKVFERIESDDPMKYMPPPPSGVPWTQRSAEDTVRQLDAILHAWVAAGQPPDVFTVQPETTTATRYLMSPEVGVNLTNIGNCVPDKRLVAIERTETAALDDKFAQMKRGKPGEGSLEERIGLPLHLSETDLTTFDSATLAHHNIIAYAPTYPLWSDGARKLRHVRVPMGESIHFDKGKQQFEIPANTRFYKTFLRKVIDKDGTERYRKIETRLIVARPNVKHDDGSFQMSDVAALFGAYVWNEDETEATLLRENYRSGEPFTDHLFTYITDEPLAASVRAEKPKNLDVALQSAGAIRHYAVPGSDRCLQCHMGSPNDSFVLGMTPIQVNRRPHGEGGVIEPPGEDELTQLQRLIDYGVISGVDDISDVLHLEDSEGDRKPRNDYELTAQGYMVGNCAHCHNPHGFPSVTNSALAPLLNFLPGALGGVFQFPLERHSPRITRGLNGSVQIPYITPSLIDFPSVLGPPTKAATIFGGQDHPPLPLWIVFAPWRSLVYRNVDTPFPYADDGALFPHMPMNTPGFDCRAPRIMADWMVSIPSRRKSQVREELVQFSTINGYSNVVTAEGKTSPEYSEDTNTQPYAEVKPGEADYEEALRAAQLRLTQYHEGAPFREGSPPYSRYAFCPDTGDIVDAKITGADKSHLTPRSLTRVRRGDEILDLDPRADSHGPEGIHEETDVILMPDIKVPAHAQWVATDVTDPPGAWTPRRSDWKDILIEHKYDSFPAGSEVPGIVEMLNPKSPTPANPGVALSAELKSYALQEIPFGLWQKKDGCKFSGVPTAASFTGDKRPRWMDLPPQPAADSPIYTELPGAAVFGMICINCHGAKADSRGRQADTLALMTGGDARVANLRDGLLGPLTMPGGNRLDLFKKELGADAQAADVWGARYMAFMGLGGTTKLIPESILSVVANTPVLGVPRGWDAHSNGGNDANMLGTARLLCRTLLPESGALHFDPKEGWKYLEEDGPRGYVETNGDLELWQRLCAIDNRPPIRVLAGTTKFLTYSSSLYAYDRYPPNTPVGDQHGRRLPSLTPDNLLPWCLQKPSDAAVAAQLEQRFIEGKLVGDAVPFCPEQLFASGPGQSNMTAADRLRWATRGAINAGLAVFLYLDQVERGLVPKPSYNQCELLP